MTARAGIVAAVALAVAVPASAGSATSSLDPGAWIRHPSAPFAITAAEVTVQQFRSCLAAGACDESTVGDLCNLGREGRDLYPVNCVSYDGAEQYCSWAGGRVCREDEWLSACRGTDDRGFPYGAAFDPDACNVHSNATAATGGTVGFDTAPVASKTTCEGGLPGLFDMAGNVAEWVDGCKGTYCKFRGAGYLSNEPVERFAACEGVCSGNQKTLMSNVVGIRCCRDEPQ